MADNLPARIDDLPASLQDVAETLGLRVAVALIEHFGGLEVKFPVAPRPDHPVINALGETDGYALCDFLAGQQIYVPHGKPARSLRAEVIALDAAGLDRATIARQIGISQRYVRMLINQRPDTRQLSLFD